MSEFFERCYVLRCDVKGKVPHDELYICCRDDEWPERRKMAMTMNPHLFSPETLEAFDVEADISSAQDSQ